MDIIPGVITRVFALGLFLGFVSIVSSALTTGDQVDRAMRRSIQRFRTTLKMRRHHLDIFRIGPWEAT